MSSLLENLWKEISLECQLSNEGITQDYFNSIFIIQSYLYERYSRTDINKNPHTFEELAKILAGIPYYIDWIKWKTQWAESTKTALIEDESVQSLIQAMNTNVDKFRSLAKILQSKHNTITKESWFDTYSDERRILMDIYSEQAEIIYGDTTAWDVKLKIQEDNTSFRALRILDK